MEPENIKGLNTVSVSVPGKINWAFNRDSEGNPSGISRRNKETLTEVVAMLTDALEQAQYQLSALDDSNPIADVSSAAA